MTQDEEPKTTQRTVQMFDSQPELMTEAELISFLRIREVSKAKNLSNVVANLKRMHGLPRIYIAGQPLFPRGAVLEWVDRNTCTGRR